jgi:cellulose synthase (UDP-forming)
MQSYDNLMEGFSVLGCAFCYGTNFIIRRRALQEVGGWDADGGTALTEDISTSFLLHRAGWRSLYIRRAYAQGVAPPTLEAFWRQQRRWATGTTYLLFKFLRYLFQGKLRSTRSSIRSAYAIALSYYTSILGLSLLIGWPTAILVSYLFSSRLFIATTTIPSWHMKLSRLMWLFASLYPFYVISSFFPYLNMKLRGYRLRNMFLVQSLLILSAPAYIKGVKDAFFHRLPGLFAITTKTPGHGRPRKLLFQLPQFYGLLLFLTTGTIMTHLLFRDPSNFVMWIIVFWLFVNSICLSHLFIFYPLGRFGLWGRANRALMQADRISGLDFDS